MRMLVKTTAQYVGEPASFDSRPLVNRCEVAMEVLNGSATVTAYRWYSELIPRLGSQVALLNRLITMFHNSTTTIERPSATVTVSTSDAVNVAAQDSHLADAKTKVYGTADPALSYKVTGMVNNDAATVVTGTLKRATGENVGTYAISNNDLAASNYTITYVGADLTITKANLTVTADAKSKVYGSSDPALTYKVTVWSTMMPLLCRCESKVYGSSDPALTYKVTGMVNNDAATVVTGTLKRATGENVGTYAISNNDLAASNYTITYVGADMTITKANLTVTADAKTKVYGSSDPALTYKVTGMVNNDAATVVTGTLKRAAGENVGTYAIGNNDLAASNYTITYVGANLTITYANLTVTADAKTKVYGSSDPALTYKVTVCWLKNVGTYAISNNDLAASNYSITYVGADLTITKAAISGITLSDASFTYDSAAKSILIAGTLPVGTSVSYTGNNQTAAGTLSLDISSNSPLPIKIYSDNTLVAEVTGNQEVTVRGVGLALIRAEQSGDANYIAADAVTRELRVRNEDGAKLPVRVHPAVSPNGDGINDYLRIEGIDEYPENKIGIFDANGNLVQELKGYDNHSNRFDGYKESRAVPAGTLSLLCVSLALGQQYIDPALSGSFGKMLNPSYNALLKGGEGDAALLYRYQVGRSRVERSTEASANFTKTLQISDEEYVGLGVNLGYTQQRGDYSSLDPGDPAFQTVQYGTLLYGLSASLVRPDKYYVGVSMPRSIFGSKESDYVRQFGRDNTFYVSSGVIFDLDNQMYIRPSLLASYRPVTGVQFDGSAMLFFHEKFGIGAGYRQRGDLMGMAEFNLGRLRIGYSYQQNLKNSDLNR
ncbi:hypothetical protein FQR65_LT17914 [Abscondita terminalis]|nr:hypothetical protein FQR65_LT17914 [Abscondita terminalis]